MTSGGAGMVHCLIRGDDAAFDTFTCTEDAPSYDATLEVPVYGVLDSGGNSLSKTFSGACLAHDSPRAGCQMDTSTPGREYAACKAQAAKEDWHCHTGGAIVHGKDCEYLCDGPLSYSLATCSTPTVTGSFEWKVSYAARRGCTAVGGVSFDPSAKDASTTGMIQGMFCPATMQRGGPPKVDSYIGALQGQREWGDCYIPQTVPMGGHAVEGSG